MKKSILFFISLLNLNLTNASRTQPFVQQDMFRLALFMNLIDIKEDQNKVILKQEQKPPQEKISKKELKRQNNLKTKLLKKP